MESTITIPRPHDESERIAALQRYLRLDNVAEEDFDLLTKVAAEICGVPYAFISLVDADSVVTMASYGLPNNTFPRDEAYCSWTVLQDSVLEIPDLSADKRTAQMRITKEAGVHMYAGTNLNTKDGFHVGTLCVLDRQPHKLSEHQQELLAGLARQVMALFELREHQKLLSEALMREHHLASVDMLTGLLNRRALFDSFEKELERSSRYATPMSFVMIDLDHFKLINDTYGHAGGDAVLRGVGELLRHGIRSSDIAGRYGGEELCVVLPQTTIEEAQGFAETMRKKIEGMTIAFGEQKIRVTASLGVAVAIVGGDDVERIVRAADTALYVAKQDGRNRVVLA